MNNLTKQIIFILSLLIFIMPITSLSSFAETDKQRVYDEVELLSEQEINDLEEMTKKYSDKRETDFVILTTNSSASAKKYMQDFYDEKGLGYDSEHGNTAIMTINMNNREVYLAGFYKGEKYLTDKRLDKVRDKITDDLTDGQYLQAFKGFIKKSDYYFDYEPNVNPDNIFYKTWFQFILALIVSLVIVGMMLYQSKSKITTTQSTYKDMNRSKVISQKDRYIRKHVTKKHSPQSKDGGGSGGGKTSGGSSHSGSGGRF